jgi:hypothetical protein
MKSAQARSRVVSLSGVGRWSQSGYLRIARIDHWFKNVFVLPGIVPGLSLDPAPSTPGLMLRIFLGMVSMDTRMWETRHPACRFRSRDVYLTETAGLAEANAAHWPRRNMWPVHSGCFSYQSLRYASIRLRTSGPIRSK